MSQLRITARESVYTSLLKESSLLRALQHKLNIALTLIFNLY